ncbi:hypothetical protein PC128_g4840 [Phytophthora cactorum]|nr:hypothetical protein PC121_g5521 [Phytophthora cactorum]KAG3200091.1 hypothetical protein PC128_g4840 [Phytophthora cactorum]
MNEQALRGRHRRVREVKRQVASSYCYSYVIPEVLVISLQAGLDHFRSRQAAERKAHNEDHDVVHLTSTPSSADGTTLAVWVTPELDPFSSECVSATRAFFRTMKTCERWENDLTWLLQDWSKVSGRPVEFLALETASNGKTAPAAKQHLVQLAGEVVLK